MKLNTSLVYLVCDEPAKLSIPCLICGESVELDKIELARLDHGLDIHSKICDSCKNAILYYRRKFESGED